jgi:hypothetical protein
MMYLSRLSKWSLLNQIEDERYRTLPDDLPQLGRFICKCWFDVAGGVNKVDDDQPDNGVGRLIMSFASGFDDSSGKMIGMPAFGKEHHSLPGCSCCGKVYSEAGGGGVELCCDSVYYCHDGNCKKLHLPLHQALSVCDEVLERRKREALAAEARMKESTKANDNAEAAAASLLAELGLEEEKESKKKKKKTVVGSGQGSKKKTTKKRGNKKKK